MEIIVLGIVIGLIVFLFIIEKKRSNSTSKPFHRHHFSKPIISRYVSFNCRDIIYECDCGKRQVVRICIEFGESFPTTTTPLITHEEFLKYLNNNKTPNGK